MEWGKEYLVDVVESLHQGLNTAGEKIKFVDAGFPIIQTRNLNNGLIDLSHKIKFMCQEDWDKYKDKYRPEVGDIFFTNIGTIGKTAIVNKCEDYLIHWNIFKIRPLPDKIISAYLRYRLDFLTDSGFFTDSQKGGTVNFVTKKMMSSVEVPLPPIPEQKRIVAILDQAFSDIEQARAKTEQNLKNARELFESYLQQMFSQCGEGWVESTLAEVSIEFGRGKSKHRPRGDASLLGGEYPLIQTGDISNSDHWITKHTRTYNDKGLNQSKLWPKGTVCIAIVGANVAETAILNFDACFPDSVIGILLDSKLANNEYVDYLLQSFKSYLKEKGKGTARDNINLGTFANQKFPFPSLSEQESIVNKLSFLDAETRNLKSVYQNKLKMVDELKKTILQKAFSGELTKAPDKETKKGVAA